MSVHSDEKSGNTMTDEELVTLITDGVSNGIQQTGKIQDFQENILKEYFSQKYGDEENDRSQIVTSDIADQVDSDMTIMARVFLGASSPVEFQATKDDEEHVREVEEKNKYIPYIIKTAQDSFATLHGWLKATLLYKYSLLEYGIETIESNKIETQTGLDIEEVAKIIIDINNDKSIDEATEIDRKEGEFGIDLSFRVKRTEEVPFLRLVPIEDTIISSNAESINKADLVGKEWRKPRGQLIDEGMDRDTVMGLARVDSDITTGSLQKSIRFEIEGGETGDPTLNAELNELVQGVDVYAMVDYHEKGTLERRHIIISSNTLLLNEPLDHVPFALASSMLMPNTLVGRGRAELVRDHQRSHTRMKRNMFDNINAVSFPRTVVSEEVDLDDMMDISLQGIIRTSSNTAAGQVVPLVVPNITTDLMQVIQYDQGQKNLSTGSQQANQALTEDHLHKETATRFEGMERAATAKIELVCRVIAEVGFRDLYEGMAWMASHYQNTPKEIYVLGKQLTVKPSAWKFDHTIVATVGVGAGDDDRILQSMGQLYSIQKQLHDEQNPLVDNKKLHNTLTKLVLAIGQPRVIEYFNDPEIPNQQLQAENEMLRKQVEAMSSQQQNPLAEAEQVKVQGQMQIEQLRSQLKIQELQAEFTQDGQQFQSKQQLEVAKLQQKDKNDEAKIAVEVGKLELAFNENLEGGLVEQ